MSASNVVVSAQKDEMVTSVSSNQYAYTWKIKKFSTWQTTVEGFQKSFKFPYEEGAKEQWVLKFNPRSLVEGDHCSLGLELVTPLQNQPKYEVEYELAMEDSTGRNIRKRSFKSDFAQSCTWTYTKFINRETILERIKFDDQLYIKCKIITNVVVDNKKVRPEKISEPFQSSLFVDFKNLVDKQKYGDVTIQIGTQRFLAYKGILSARSSVFAAMFEHEMQETIENSVSIDDIEPDVFGELLVYIYTDQLTVANKLDTLTHKLYTAADKYDIPTLKSLCRNHIMGKLSWKTAADTLVLADLHSDLLMKNETLQFLGGSVAAKVTKTDGWKNMVQTHPHLVNEVVRALAEKLSSEQR